MKPGLLLFLLICSGLIGSCAFNDGTSAIPIDAEFYPDEGPGYPDNISQSSIDEELAQLAADTLFEHLDSIAFEDWVSYFSGYYYSSHLFACIVFHPAEDKFLVSGWRFKQWFERKDSKLAFSSYRELLTECGFDTQLIETDTSERVRIVLEDHAIDKAETRARFTEEEYKALSATRTSAGYRYYSGMGEESWHFPLMYAHGADRLTLLGAEGMAGELSFAELDAAFSAFEAYVNDHF